MQEYQVPMKRGILGLAVLGSDVGSVVYSQQNGEFENARNLTLRGVARIPEQMEAEGALVPSELT